MNEEAKKDRIRGLSSVRVATKWLLDKVKKNREKHTLEFQEALEGWHSEVVKIMSKELSKLRKDKNHEPNFFVPKPKDHTDEYDRIIAMLGASTDETLELTAHEFATYAMDEWGWKKGFAEMVTNYSNKLR